MTPVQTRAHEVGSPSLPQLWLGAMLRAFVELVQNVASTLRMNLNLQPRDWHTQPAQEALPEEKTDTQQQETIRDRRAPARQSTRSVENAAAHDDDPAIIIISRATPTGSFSGLSRESRLAHHRDHAFNVPLIPAKAGTQGGTRGLLRIEASIPFKTRNRSWIPAFAGMSGDGSVREKSAPA